MSAKVKRFYVDVLVHDTPQPMVKGDGTPIKDTKGVQMFFDKQFVGGVTRGSRQNTDGSVSWYSQLTLRAEDGDSIQLFDKTGNVIRENLLVRRKRQAATAGVQEVPAGTQAGF